VKIARVFPRRTSATPTDEMVFVGDPPLFLPEVEEVHVSCVFTWDKMEAERLAVAWGNQGYKVSLGGPAFGSPSEEFTPGRYVKTGMTITSRGCVRSCPFCFVPKREGKLRLLEIKPGHDILDNNLLACPKDHIERVLDMLDTQPKAARFTGGIDARLVEPWFSERLGTMRLDILYTAFDHPSQQDSVWKAVSLFQKAGIEQRKIGCYVLVGYDGDTVDQAENRLKWVFGIGGMPFAMYYRPPEAKIERPEAWKSLVRSWSRPAAIFSSQREPF
jgi:hypothetical protein